MTAMKRNYVAVIGPPEDASRASGRIDREIEKKNKTLSKIVKDSQVTLYIEQDLKHIDISGCGIIIGKIFSKNGHLITHLSSKEADEIISSEGKALTEIYWGSYIAIINNPNESKIIRDPSSTFPCFYFRYQNLTIATSCPRLAQEVGIFSPRISWLEVQRRLLYRDLREAHTCLDNFLELIPGQSLSVRSNLWKLEELWSPWQFAKRSMQYTAYEESVAALRYEIKKSISALSSCFNSILIGVSGGLDSSIVAVNISKQTPVHCMTFIVSRGTLGDERKYARSLSDLLKTPLLESYSRTSDVNILFSDAADLPWPIARSFSQAVDKSFIEKARSVSADAIFSGNGGDSVLCHMASAAIVADCLIESGFGRKLFDTAIFLSALNQSSLLYNLRSGIKLALSSRSGIKWPKDESFLAFREGKTYSAPSHPWLTPPHRSLPGKTEHVASILGSHNHVGGFYRRVPEIMISPLAAQPVVETCLRIPTWFWINGGRNRAVCRDAFATSLPEIVLNRQSKGTPDSFYFDVFEKNYHLIAETISNGLLARHGIIDKEMVMKSLNHPSHITAPELWRIMSFMDTEAWANSWS